MKVNSALVIKAIVRGVNSKLHDMPPIKDKVFKIDYTMINYGDCLLGLGHFVLGEEILKKCRNVYYM